MKYKRGFTLIELLVVIAIIGILSSVVLASLNSARQKGQITAIKSNLKNIIPQAELTYDIPGNYSTVCANANIVNMLTAITNAGGTASCYSYSGAGDVYTRWGVAARLNSDSTQNFAVDPMGVVTFDTSDKSSSNWADANAACATSGGRLPSPEELRALWLSYGSVSIPVSTGFIAGGYYWSSITVLSNSTKAYGVALDNGSMSQSPDKTSLQHVRCVH